MYLSMKMVIFLVLDHAREEHMTLVNHFGQAWYLLREAIAKVGQYHKQSFLCSLMGI